MALALLSGAACRYSPSAAATPAADAPRMATGASGGGPAAEAPKPSALPPPAEYEVEGHRFALVVEHDACYISPHYSRGRDARLPLGFPPPCHLLLWRQPPPIEHPKDAAPLGQLGDPMAWKFSGRQPVVALVVIGGPISERQKAKRPHAKDTECASRTRGLLLQGQSLKLSKRTGDSFVCTTSGLDEKDFWLFAHEP